MSSYERSERSGSGGKILLIFAIGCLGLILLAIASCAVGVFFLARNIRTFGADIASAALTSAIEESELSESDKREIKAEVERIRDEFKAGNVSGEQVGLIFQALAESPLFPMGMLYAIEQEHIADSDLDAQEKEDARLVLQRVSRGLFERTIDAQQLNEPMRHISRTDREGSFELKQKVSAEELRAFIAECRQLADDAGIPEEEFQVDIAAEFKRAVDRALSGDMQPGQFPGGPFPQPAPPIAPPPDAPQEVEVVPPVEEAD